MANKNLTNAKKAKNDEFCTQYGDIQKEIEAYLEFNPDVFRGNGSDMVFAVPNGSEIAESDKQKAARLGYVGDYTRLGNSCWFTNLDHGRRHKPLPLMTMEENLKYSKHKEIKGKKAYDKYGNYNAIEVPFTDSIWNLWSRLVSKW